jgi:hypothetical protein
MCLDLPVSEHPKPRRRPGSPLSYSIAEHNHRVSRVLLYVYVRLLARYHNTAAHWATFDAAVTTFADVACQFAHWRL